MDSHTPWDLPRLPDRVGRLRALLIIHFRDSTLLVGVGLLLAAIQLERPWLQVMPFPPVTVLMLNLTLHWVLGGMVLLMNNSETQNLPADYAGLD